MPRQDFLKLFEGAVVPVLDQPFTLPVPRQDFLKLFEGAVVIAGIGLGYLAWRFNLE